MIKFLVNLLKVLFKKEAKYENTDNVIKFSPKIKWINDDVGVEKTKNGLIIHAVGRELTPEEIVNIIKDNMH